MELVSAAREYETRARRASLGGFVDQLSLLSDVDEEAGTRDARVLMMTMHSAKGSNSLWSSSPASRRDCSRTRVGRR
jgi:superfamily I DNA/RNA helicase